MVLFFHIPQSLYGKESLALVKPGAHCTSSGQKAILSRVWMRTFFQAALWALWDKLWLGSLLARCPDRIRLRRSKIMYSFSTSSKTEGSLKQGWIFRKCLESKADSFLSNKMQNEKNRTKKDFKRGGCQKSTPSSFRPNEDRNSTLLFKMMMFIKIEPNTIPNMAQNYNRSTRVFPKIELGIHWNTYQNLFLYYTYFSGEIVRF